MGEPVGEGVARVTRRATRGDVRGFGLGLHRAPRRRLQLPHERRDVGRRDDERVAAHELADGRPHEDLRVVELAVPVQRLRGRVGAPRGRRATQLAGHVDRVQEPRQAVLAAARMAGPAAHDPARGEVGVRGVEEHPSAAIGGGAPALLRHGAPDRRGRAVQPDARDRVVEPHVDVRRVAEHHHPSRARPDRLVGHEDRVARAALEHRHVAGPAVGDPEPPVVVEHGRSRVAEDTITPVEHGVGAAAPRVVDPRLDAGTAVDDRAVAAVLGGHGAVGVLHDGVHGGGRPPGVHGEHRHGGHRRTLGPVDGSGIQCLEGVRVEGHDPVPGGDVQHIVHQGQGRRPIDLRRRRAVPSPHEAVVRAGHHHPIVAGAHRRARAGAGQPLGVLAPRRGEPAVPGDDDVRRRRPLLAGDVRAQVGVHERQPVVVGRRDHEPAGVLDDRRRDGDPLRVRAAREDHQGDERGPHPAVTGLRGAGWRTRP